LISLGAPTPRAERAPGEMPMVKVRDTIDENDVARFSRLSGQWWNPHGPWAKLHKFNEVRLGYIRDRAAAYFGGDRTWPDSLRGLRMLDIGCGGGILSEPLARLGAGVVGIDPSASNITVAKAHAAEAGLSIDYRGATVEELAKTGETFDVVLAMEVVEHVADVGLFLDLAAATAKPDGLMFLGTLNRTIRSFAVAIAGAEYILGWIPRGTHQWSKFVTPHELETALKQNGLNCREKAGVIYNPFAGRFQLSNDTSVSYMVVAEKISRGHGSQAQVAIIPQ
jgi:2-polyprenyl-6-hydroxyphenyl methylase / 3-demethylubiquinone-9 3-methyltransferase